MVLRQDAWTEQDDLTLAETVLAHIRNGSTQLAAFEEVAEKLNRTSAACGFRWNGDVRKRCENEIIEAKEYRKHTKKSKEKEKWTLFIDDKEFDPKEELALVSQLTQTQELQQPIVTDYIEQIVQASKNLKQQHTNTIKRIETLSEELKQAREEIETLKNKMVSESPQSVASEDYQALIQILSRARSLGVLEKLSS